MCLLSHTGIVAITLINEAIDSGDENATLQALQLPAAKLKNISPEQAFHYQVLLAKRKDKKAEVFWLQLIEYIY